MFSLFRAARVFDQWQGPFRTKPLNYVVAFNIWVADPPGNSTNKKLEEYYLSGTSYPYHPSVRFISMITRTPHRA